MDVALFVAHTPTFLTELKIYSRFLVSKEIAMPVFVIAYDPSLATSFQEECQSKGVECRNAATFTKQPKGLLDKFYWLRICSIDRIFALLFFGLIAWVAGVQRNFFRDIHLFNKSTDQIRSMLHEIKPAYLILGGDMPGYDSALYIKEAKKLGIQSFVIPSTMSNGKEQAEIYFSDSQYHAAVTTHRIFALFFKNWSKQYREIMLFRVPIGRLLAIKLFQIEVEKPWVFNSTNADIVFLESLAMRDYYSAVGLAANNLVVTGAPTSDLIYEVDTDINGIKTRLRTKYCLDGYQKVVLIALPPDFFYVVGGRPQSIYANHTEVINFFRRLICAHQSVKWIISLHPSMTKSDYGELELAGATIIDEPAYQLLPLCDIYLATVSSTIRWAIACGVPVINYDFYRYRYDDFESVDGVLYATTEEVFELLLNALLEQIDFLQRIKAQQQLSAPGWGLLDGKCCERINQEIQQQLNSKL
jgi:hypothetical protein